MPETENPVNLGYFGVLELDGGAGLAPRQACYSGTRDGKDQDEDRRILLVGACLMGTAIFVAIFTAILVAISLPFVMWGEKGRAAAERARARRMAEHRMYARLLRLSI